MRMTGVAMAQFGWRVAAGTLAVTTALLVAATLGLATLGIVATTLAVALGLSVLTGAGFTHAVSFIVARGPATAGRSVDQALALTVAVSLAVSALVAAVGPLALSAMPVLWGHVAIVLPFVQVGQLGLGLHQGLGSYRGYALTYVAQPLTAFCIAVTAAAVPGIAAEVWVAGSLVVAPFVVQAATVIPAWLALRRDVPGEPIRTLVTYTARIYPSAVAHYLSYRLDLLLVGGLLGAAAAGIYSLALNSVDAVARIGQAAATVRFPRFAVMREAEDPGLLVRRTAFAAGSLSLAVSAALAALVLIAGRSLGPQVNAVGVLLAILTLAGGAVSAWTVIASYLAARDRLGAVARVNAALLATSLALYLTLIPTIGVPGAALGTSVGLAVAALMGFREVSGRAGPRSFEIRGRHLMLADVGVMAVSTAVVWSVGGGSLPVWAAAAVIVLRVALLTRGRVYRQARSLHAFGELARVSLLFAAASLPGYAIALREALADAATAQAAIAECAISLLLMIVVRAGLTMAGIGRRREVGSSTVAVPGTLPRELDQMLEALAAAPPVYRPSRFWEDLNRRHFASLASEDGFRHFKRTVNMSYFQFGTSGFWRSLPVLLVEWLRHPDASVFKARMDGTDARRGLATLIALYANAVAHRPQGRFVAAITEPAVGDPLIVRFGTHAVTEDLCHSVEEFDTVVSALPASVQVRRALELGAGYGRLAYVWLHARPEVQYYIVDIPPALYLSQRYLREVLPDVATFTFRPFRDHAEVAAEMSRAQLVFLEPQQLELLPDDHIDLFMTVSTLHEMRPDQIARYLAIAERVCRGAFYTKQWRYFYNDVDGTTLTRDSYPVPATWRLVAERTPLVPRSFFEALYLCRP